MANLLVVEDDDVDRELVDRCLEGYPGLRVRHVSNAEAALEVVQQETFDVVLTDLRMPGMTGLQLVERLGAEYPLSPVILMTFMGNENIAVEALKAGAASYVPKSQLKELLADTIGQVLDLAKARQSRRQILMHLDGAELRFDLPSDPSLAHPLAAFLQDNLAQLDFGTDAVRTQIGIALMEALDNAIVHGNLEVESDLRRQSRQLYLNRIAERRGTEPFRSRRLRLHVVKDPEFVEYRIEDDGPGFDLTRLPDPVSPENLLNVYGRGILLMRTFMDDVRYEGRGNRLILRKNGALAAVA